MLGTRRTMLLGAATLVADVSCGGGSKVPETSLIVFAAASLRDVFTEVAGAFRSARDGAEVRLAFAGTHQLRAQIEHGAAADVLVAADERHMAALVDAGRVDAPVVVARNEPVVIVDPGAGGPVRTFADLPHARRIAVGVPEVPIGRYTAHILERAATVHGDAFPAAVEARVVSRELDVRQVMAKVVLGEADAGIVYRSDAVAAGDAVRVVAIPPSINVVATYPAAVVRGTLHPATAGAFIAFLRADEGQRAWLRAGFLLP